VGKRILTTVLGLPILFFVLYKGGLLLTLSLLVVTMIGLSEFYNSMKKSGYFPMSGVGYAGTLAIYAGLGIFQETDILTLTIPFILMTLMIYWILTNPKHNLMDLVITWFGLTYVTMLLIPIVLIDGLAFSYGVWLIFIISWSCDSSAYLVGVGFGKHKLCPSISPKKTIEGAVGGILGSMLGCTIFSWLVSPDKMVILVMLGFIGAIVSQLGDLAASQIKRTVGIKDFGQIFPGHGGVLDRFDSILFTAPLVYFFLSHWMMR